MLTTRTDDFLQFVLPAILLITWVCVQPAQGQAGAGAEDEQLFEQIMSDAWNEGLHSAPMGTIMRWVGRQFLGKPYAAGLLDKFPEETLVVDLTQFDCVLYVEVVLALAQGVALEDYAFDSFRKRLELLRYRYGVRDGYCSRLHYFTEWIIDNEDRGHVTDVTREIGGVRLKKSLDFMSSHRDSYPRLTASDSLFQGIVAMEQDLAGMQLFHVPQEDISSIYGALRDGDVLALSTHIDGLDVTHTGLAYAWGDGSFGLLHASVSDGVVISRDLEAYVRRNAMQIGIIVARPVDPRLSY